MDIETGEVSGYKLKNVPDFDILRQDSYSEINVCYRGTNVDDELIYASIYDEKGVSINIFDWEGNFKRVLYLNSEK
jgi:hypothetical protein